MQYIKFFKQNCLPCNSVSSMISSLDNIPEIKELDVYSDEAKDYLTKFGIRSAPTILKLDDEGNEVDRITGMQTKQDLIEFFGEKDEH